MLEFGDVALGHVLKRREMCLVGREEPDLFSGGASWVAVWATVRAASFPGPVSGSFGPYVGRIPTADSDHGLIMGRPQSLPAHWVVRVHWPGPSWFRPALTRWPLPGANPRDRHLAPD